MAIFDTIVVCITVWVCVGYHPLSIAPLGKRVRGPHKSSAMRVTVYHVPESGWTLTLRAVKNCGQVISEAMKEDAKGRFQRGDFM